MSKYVQTEPFRNQHDVQSMIRCTIKDELERIKWCRETKSYAKNLPKALTEASVHHEQQVGLRKEVATGTAVADEEAA